MGGSSFADRRRLGVALERAPDVESMQGRVVEALRAAHRVLLTTHRSPDGDGVGSAAGLAVALRALGKEVTLYTADPIPEKLAFLPEAAEFVRTLPANARFDLSVVTDCAELDRLGPHFPPPERRGKLIFIDHHPHAGAGADLHLRDDLSPAVGVMVLRIVRALGVPLGVRIAEPLYTSLVSDTGSFRYANTSPEAMRCAAELLEAGVDPWRVASHLYENEPPERLRLLQRVLATLEVSADGRCAALCATAEMLRQAGATPDLLDGFINHARAIRGVEVALFFREQEGGCHEVSFRSRGNVNVGAIAAELGGGGHFHAAGCAVGGDFDEVRARVHAAVQRALA